MMRLIVVLAVVCVSVVGAVADPFSFYGNTVDVEYWAGGGSEAENLAVLVLDFENASGSYAFGYGWDGVDPVVEFDLLNAVDAAGSFSLTSHFDAGFSQNVVDTLSYAGDTIGDAPYPEDYPYSFNSTDGVNWNELFTGVDTTLVSDGDYIGWSAQDEGWVETEPGVWVPPNYNTPNTPVPEPGTISLFGLGAALVALRKRRSRA
jgi:hypothetical protein